MHILCDFARSSRKSKIRILGDFWDMKTNSKGNILYESEMLAELNSNVNAEPFREARNQSIGLAPHNFM